MQWNLYLRFAVAVLATWLVTHLLANEDGRWILFFAFVLCLAGRCWED